LADDENDQVELDSSVDCVLKAPVLVRWLSLYPDPDRVIRHAV
jgi:hypothetical protein